MLPVILFILACVCSAIHLVLKKRRDNILETFLAYLIFFNIGIMGILGFYSHIFMADETARLIGWAPGSPFQTEIGIANLSLGVLGILAFWLRGLFWVATVIGENILFIGAFIFHMIELSRGNTAPYNSGIFIWISDLVIPLILLSLLVSYLMHHTRKQREE